MILLFFPELFYQISVSLNDKEKIFLIYVSKTTYNFKSLLILDSEYNLEEINDKWQVKNILIRDFSLENKIKELIKDLIPESIVVNSKYVKFVSNNINVKLFYGLTIIEKLVIYECPYLIMKIMLNNNGSIENINKHFLCASEHGYLDVVRLFIDLGADIHVHDNKAIIDASWEGHLSVIKLLIELGADIHAQNNLAVFFASLQGHLSTVKLLIDSGADIHAGYNRAIIFASKRGHLSVVKLLIDSGANIHARNDQAIIEASDQGHLSVVKMLIEFGANVHAQNNKALFMLGGTIIYP